MPPTAAEMPREAIPPIFENGDQWLHARGDVPLNRVLFKPRPGTATEDDVVRLRERDSVSAELVFGTIVERPGGFEYGMIVVDAMCAIYAFVEKSRTGDVINARAATRLKSGGIVRPDVAFISWAQFPDRKIPKEPVPAIAPDLVVELFRDGNTRRELLLKIRDYFDSGTRMAWLVDPATRQAEVFISSPQIDAPVNSVSVVTGGDVLPGFVCPVADFFQQVDAFPTD